MKPASYLSVPYHNPPRTKPGLAKKYPFLACVLHKVSRLDYWNFLLTGIQIFYHSCLPPAGLQYIQFFFYLYVSRIHTSSVLSLVTNSTTRPKTTSLRRIRPSFDGAPPSGGSVRRAAPASAPRAAPAARSPTKSRPGKGPLRSVPCRQCCKCSSFGSEVNY
jgi:hypothetical protein